MLSENKVISLRNAIVVVDVKMTEDLGEKKKVKFHAML